MRAETAVVRRELELAKAEVKTMPVMVMMMVIVLLMVVMMVTMI